MFLFLPFIFLTSQAQAADITIYQDQRALVKEELSFPLKAGISNTPPIPVPWGFKPSSVLISPKDIGNKAAALEQNFFGGWTNPTEILEQFIGKEVELKENKKSKTLKGILLEARDNLTALKVGHHVYLNPQGTWVIPSLPKEGFNPSVSWKMKAENSGQYLFEFSYLTQDLSWQANYAAVINDSSNLMDLRIWADLDNQSGIDFKKAHILLVAGEPHQALPAAARPRPLFRAMAAAPQAIIDNSQNLFEYHLYSLPSFVHLKKGSVRVSMGEAFQVPVKKIYRYDSSDLNGNFSAYTRVNPDYGANSQGEVKVIFRLKNTKASNLGFPLPPGKIRVYQKDKSGSLEWLGSDSLPATPRNEKLSVAVGGAFDVLGQRKRVLFETGPKKTKEGFEITLTNRKNSDVSVKVIEHLYRWSKWKIVSSDQKWKKKDAQTIVFEIPVKKNSSSKIDYTVEYSWR